MSIRLMASPPILVGTAWVAKAEQYCSASITRAPTNADGSPASSWVLTFGRAASWVAADADTDITRVFSHPSDNVATVKESLRIMTLGDLSAAERTRLTGVFSTLEVPASDFVLTTPLWKIQRRLIGWMMAMDDGLGGGDNF